METEEDKWLNNFEEVKRYIDINNKRPSCQDKNQSIKYLGCWIISQKNNYKNIKGTMQIETIYRIWTDFITTYSKYFNSSIESWHETFAEVLIYINTNSKKPNERDADPKGKILNKWISHQQNNYNKKMDIMKNEEIREIWDDFINNTHKKYFLSNEEIWKDILSEVCEYINKYNKKPSAGNIDISIKKLGKWISVQKTNYTKNINCMKDKEIRDTWISFLTDPAYAKYF